MSSRRELPQWERKLRAELTRINANLLFVYDAWYGHFDGDASAPDLIKHLTARRCAWAAVHRTTMRRWMNTVRDCRNRHLPAPKTAP